MDADLALHAEGLVNGRDLGGLTRSDGSSTPRGVFYLSENLDQLTPAGWQALRTAGINTIVDLRHDDERARDTSPRPDWVTTLTVDLDGLDDASFWKDCWDSGLCATDLYYLPHLAAMPERAIGALTAIVTAPPGGVLFHRAQGRDRTGLIALLLLTAAGVRTEDIVQDYPTTVRLGAVLAAARGRADNEPEREALCAAYGTSTEGAFLTAVEGLDLAGVLTAGGIEAHARAAMTTWRGSMTALQTDPDR